MKIDDWKRSCGDCVHDGKKLSEEPCDSCDIRLGNPKFVAKECRNCKYYEEDEHDPNSHCFDCSFTTDNWEAKDGNQSTKS